MKYQNLWLTCHFRHGSHISLLNVLCKFTDKQIMVMGLYSLSIRWVSHAHYSHRVIIWTCRASDAADRSWTRAASENSKFTSILQLIKMGWSNMAESIPSQSVASSDQWNDKGRMLPQRFRQDRAPGCSSSVRGCCPLAGFRRHTVFSDCDSSAPVRSLLTVEERGFSLSICSLEEGKQRCHFVCFELRDVLSMYKLQCIAAKIYNVIQL